MDLLQRDHACSKQASVQADATHPRGNIWHSHFKARDDSKRPCCICQEHFGVHQQVLLSCTHVFHRACLRAFEQHSGVRSCPLCRQHDYQARLINVSQKIHVCKSSTICHRSCLARLIRRDLTVLQAWARKKQTKKNIMHLKCSYTCLQSEKGWCSRACYQSGYNYPSGLPRAPGTTGLRSSACSTCPDRPQTQAVREKQTQSIASLNNVQSLRTRCPLSVDPSLQPPLLSLSLASCFW